MQAKNRATVSHAALSMALLLLASTAAFAGGTPPDLSGQWELTSDIFLPPSQPPPNEGTGQTPCSFAGTADIAQTGGDFTGTADLGLVSGPQACPAQMDATVTGSVDQNGSMEAAMLDGQLGTAVFNGTVGGGPPMDGDPTGAGGGVVVENGNFTGSTGTWNAILGAPPIVAIPTLTALGLIALIALLAASAFWSVRRRAAA